MYVVKAAVVAHAVDGALYGTVVSKAPDSFRDVFTISNHRAAVAECPQVLLDDEARADGIAKLPLAQAGTGPIDGLCAVFDYEETVFLRDIANGPHIRAQPI